MSWGLPYRFEHGERDGAGASPEGPLQLTIYSFLVNPVCFVFYYFFKVCS